MIYDDYLSCFYVYYMIVLWCFMILCDDIMMMQLLYVMYYVCDVATLLWLCNVMMRWFYLMMHLYMMMYVYIWWIRDALWLMYAPILIMMYILNYDVIMMMLCIYDGYVLIYVDAGCMCIIMRWCMIHNTNNVMMLYVIHDFIFVCHYTQWDDVWLHGIRDMRGLGCER